MTTISMNGATLEVAECEPAAHLRNFQHPYPRLTLARVGGDHAFTATIDLSHRAQVDTLMTALRPYGTVGDDADQERQAVRTALAGVLGSWATSSGNTNAELAERCTGIYDTLRKRAKESEERVDQERRKRVDVEADLKAIETRLSEFTGTGKLSVLTALDVLLGDRRRAEEALSGRRR